MVKIIDTNTMAILGKEYIDITIGRITMKLAFNIDGSIATELDISTVSTQLLPTPYKKGLESH